MVNWNDKQTLYRFVRVACSPKFDIEEKYISQILDEEFEKEYPNMLCEIFTELTVAYYQGYGY